MQVLQKHCSSTPILNCEVYLKLPQTWTFWVLSLSQAMRHGRFTSLSCDTVSRKGGIEGVTIHVIQFKLLISHVVSLISHVLSFGSHVVSQRSHVLSHKSNETPWQVTTDLLQEYRKSRREGIVFEPNSKVRTEVADDRILLCLDWISNEGKSRILCCFQFHSQ